MTALNPVCTIGTQIIEALLAHQRMNSAETMRRALDLLRLVGIPSPERRVHDYPHQLSGGVRQRVIAMALANEPGCPFSMSQLPRSTSPSRRRFLDLVRELRSRANTAVLSITHDIGVITELRQQVVDHAAAASWRAARSSR